MYTMVGYLFQTKRRLSVTNLSSEKCLLFQNVDWKNVLCVPPETTQLVQHRTWMFVKLTQNKNNQIVIKMDSICATSHPTYLLRLNHPHPTDPPLSRPFSNWVNSLMPTIATHMLCSKACLVPAMVSLSGSFRFCLPALVSPVTAWDDEWSRWVCRHAWLGIPCWLHYCACPVGGVK